MTPLERSLVPSASPLHADAAHDQAFCAAAGRLAVRSLYEELVLYPKPGLVSLIDSGSHQDMDARTFMRSLFSLRHYFLRITAAGMAGACFDELKRLGIRAEREMLAATGGINTHRGAIFCLGMLCAALGRIAASGAQPSPEALRATLRREWGAALMGHADARDAQTHGAIVASRHAASGAREEMALGLPSVFDVALPRLQATYQRSGDMRLARIDALFALMAHMSDTNVYFRGGAAGADMVREQAAGFLQAGGAAAAGWEERALDMHRLLVRHRLSPGGAADLLGATCLVHEACRRPLPGADGA
ncbi:triphosphoribosyl-dephospho-CoA synthase [Noviherbaspirillum humi]|uniref:triphosphoribosyl-dephospho-CoA synthase n=1 Tax=Noviherbaspirillum humi TaxID=1688639 RepID=A0A239KZU3_9BURK|nr:triphosphoribosyl-dephospho-CoA synthase MdcB [Noviherbaspirillum humi]SNT23731.1 triphosphoribosyl-dephospho-CoA synthase [Noviherbaspirillum humi]